MRAVMILYKIQKQSNYYCHIKQEVEREEVVTNSSYIVAFRDSGEAPV